MGFLDFFRRSSRRVDAAEAPSTMLVRRGDATSGARALANAQTGLGYFDGPDRSASNRPAPILELSEQEIADLFRGSVFARRIILEPAADATRAGWEVQGEGIPADEINSALADLNTAPAYFESDWKGELSGGAGTVLLTKEESEDSIEPLRAPLNEEQLLAVQGLTVASKEELIPLYPFNFDRKDPKNFGKPKFYTWQPFWSGQSLTVHHSRVIRWEGVPLHPRHGPKTRGWGDSRLQAVWENLRDYASASGNVSNIVETFTQTAMKIRGLAEMLSQAAVTGDQSGQALLEERLLALGKSMHNLRMMFLDAETEGLEKIGTPVAGLADLLSTLMINLCAAANMPATKLFGIAPPGLSTDDLSGSRNWELIVRARQTTRYEPALRRLVHLILKSKNGPTRGELVDFKITFLPLSEPTDKERAEIDETNSRTLGNIRDCGGITGLEMRHAVWKGTRTFGGVSVDVEDEPAPPPPAVEDPNEEMSEPSAAEADPADTPEVSIPVPSEQNQNSNGALTGLTP